MKKSKNCLFIFITFFLWGCLNNKLKEDSKVIRIDNIVDLTHTLTSDFPFIPVKKLTYPFELIPMATLKENGVEANSWKIHEHLGTHTDAPNHFIKSQKSLDQIDLKDLIVPVIAYFHYHKKTQTIQMTMNVQKKGQGKMLLSTLSRVFPSFKINFDLSDCDKILRVNGEYVEVEKIIVFINDNGFKCEVSA